MLAETFSRKCHKYPDRLTNDDCGRFRELEARVSTMPLEYSSACNAIVHSDMTYCSVSSHDLSCRETVFLSLRTTCDVAAGEQVWVDCIQGAVKQSGFVDGCDRIGSETGDSVGAAVCRAGALQDANSCLNLEPAAAREVCCNAISDPIENDTCMQSILTVDDDASDEPIIEGETLTLDEVLGSDDDGSTGDTSGLSSASSGDEEFDPKSGTYMFCPIDDSIDCAPYTITFVESGRVLLLKYRSPEPLVFTRVDERTYVFSVDTASNDDEPNILGIELYFESSEHVRASGGMNGAIELAGYMDYVE